MGSLGSIHFFLEHELERERSVKVARTLEELVLELYPVEAESVQEALENIHHHQHAKSYSHEWVPNHKGTDCKSANTCVGAKLVPRNNQNLLQENKRKLGVSKG